MAITLSVIAEEWKERRRLAGWLDRAAGFLCVSSFASVDDASLSFRESVPDIILLDLALAEQSEMEGIGGLRRSAPGVPIVVLTSTQEVGVILRALACGACGHISKSDPSDRLLQALEEVSRGGTPLSSVVARRLIELVHQQLPPQPPTGQLSIREKQILALLAEGYPYKQIAAHLTISINTVRTYVRRLYGKLQVPCRMRAVLKCQPVSIGDVAGDRSDDPFRVGSATLKSRPLAVSNPW